MLSQVQFLYETHFSFKYKLVLDLSELLSVSGLVIYVGFDERKKCPGQKSCLASGEFSDISLLGATRVLKLLENFSKRSNKTFVAKMSPKMPKQ